MYPASHRRFINKTIGTMLRERPERTVDYVPKSKWD
ncbi:hypothetical protein FAES_1520 [Fibrella aestuarina BUZ 2]|uniref:Uncharacterized protein n=1 Tax=Fibrella aestuarina BUZ 2 TaxID=1166018 RepID=I0K5X7_9BACT|nr:hypothetical protein FAES_1520 [Fibrella aestuarina BUZ 2]